MAVEETSSVVTNSAHRSGRAKPEGMMANFRKSEMQGALELLSVLCIADSVAVVVSTSVVSKDEQQRGLGEGVCFSAGGHGK